MVSRPPKAYLFLLLVITLTGLIMCGYYFLSAVNLSNPPSSSSSNNNDLFIDLSNPPSSPPTNKNDLFIDPQNQSPECPELIKNSKIGFPVQCAYNHSDNKTIVIGIPFVFRSLGVGAKYLVETLTTTLSHITEEQKRKVQIIILNSDMNLLRHAHLHRFMNMKFQGELQDGTIVVYSMNIGEYPEKLISDPCSLKPPEGDSLMRARWMAKLSWDTLTLMKIAMSRGKYYLQMEDDTPPHHDWFGRILEHIKYIETCSKISLNSWEVCSEVPNKWFMVQFGKKHAFSSKFGGMFGLFWHAEDLSAMVMWIQERFDTMPIDWLVGEYTSQAGLAQKVYSHDPLFDHTGGVSTKVGVDDTYVTSAYDELVTWEQCQNQKRWELDW